MSELQLIEGVLERTSRRRRWDRAWAFFWRAFLLGCILWLGTLVLYKLLPLPQQILTWSGLLALALLPAGFLLGWARKISRGDSARWVDGRLQLQERLSTALEVASTPGVGTWRDLLLDDAAKCARNLDPKRFLPFHLPKASRWALLVLALSVGLGFIPEYRSEQYRKKQREAEVIREAGKQMAELVRLNLERRPPAMEPTRRSMESAIELGEQLTKAKLTREEALKDLASVTEKLKQETKELGKNPAFKRMEQSARTPSGNPEQTSATLQKKIEDLQKALGNQAANSDALEKFKKDLQKLKEAAAGMSSKDASQAEAAREQMEKSLAELSQRAKDAGLSIPGLQAAIEALKANQADLFLRDLNLALNDLEKMKEMAKQLEQLQQQAEKLGRDLAEQLKLGQAEAAEQTLKKMVEQLKQSNLTPEQLERLLQEVSKAIDPASTYGKVGDLLKQAAQQLKQAEKPGAAQSLADAAAELAKMLEQFGDGQSLAAALEALQRASFCIGNCQGWGQCKSLRVGFNKGGKPGRGVGTWADENGWLFYPEITDRWDNSGVQRPDMDPRGQTDRGDGALADNIAPTKIRGQFNPGGSMPSITLKGVSIKGQSKVEYEAAVMAAQTEAQGALNQDQVPRAYQGAVRDYFDDLKQ